MKAITSTILILLFFVLQMQAQRYEPKLDSLTLYNQETQILQPKQIVYYEEVEELPEFPGGSEALRSYIGQHLTYPEQAKEDSVQGKVVARFLVSPSGALVNIKILKQPAGGELLAKETQRILRAMPRWKPGKLKGEPVYVEIKLPVMFSLEN